MSSQLNKFNRGRGQGRGDSYTVKSRFRGGVGGRTEAGATQYVEVQYIMGNGNTGPPLPNRMTDTTENVTFLQLRC